MRNYAADSSSKKSIKNAYQTKKRIDIKMFTYQKNDTFTANIKKV